MKRLKLALLAELATISLVALVGTAVSFIWRVGWSGVTYPNHTHESRRISSLILEFGDLRWTHRSVDLDEYLVDGQSILQMKGEDLSGLVVDKAVGRPKLIQPRVKAQGFLLSGWGWLSSTVEFSHVDPSQEKNRFIGSDSIEIVNFPIWPLILLGLWPFLVWRNNRRRAKRAKLGQCLECGYDLRATPDRCPECGTNAAPFANQRSGAVFLFSNFKSTKLSTEIFLSFKMSHSIISSRYDWDLYRAQISDSLRVLCLTNQQTQVL